jgi:hypothetical protein
MAQDNQNRNDYGLFNISLEHLSPSEPIEAFVEQYKLYIEQIDKLADRRHQPTHFFSHSIQVSVPHLHFYVLRGLFQC